MSKRKPKRPERPPRTPAQIENDRYCRLYAEARRAGWSPRDLQRMTIHELDAIATTLRRLS